MEQINFSYHIYLDEIELTQEYIDFVNNVELELSHINYTSYYKEDNIILKNKTFNIILPFLKKIKNKGSILFEHCWVQKYKKEQYHHLHTHGSGGYSFVLYVSETKNSSNTCFFNPGYPYVHTHEYISKPKKGKIILFDKTIPHSVEPNKDEERLIVSGNIVFNECSL